MEVIYSVVQLLECIVILGAIGYLIFSIFCIWQGDHDIRLFPEKRSAFVLHDLGFNEVTFSCEIPFKNTGKQNGTLMDVFPRPLLPQEQCDSVRVHAWVTSVEAPRADGYWKAEIYKPGQGGRIRLYVTLVGRSGSIRNDAKWFPAMNIDVVSQVVGRSDYSLRKARVTLTEVEVARAWEV